VVAVPPGAESEPRGLGETLRAAREAKRLSMEDLIRTTRIQPRYLEAIEEDRFTDLPPPPYAQIFLASYAKAVGIPAREILDRYCGITGETQASRVAIWEESAEAAPAPRRRPLGLWVSVGAVVALLVVIALLARRG
jgi:cytoskeletal protein RodZ